MSKPHLLLAFLLGSLAVSCSTGSLRPYRPPLEEGLRDLADDDNAAVVEGMERLIAGLPEETTAHSLVRFHAESLAAQAHSAASLGQPFRQEHTTARSLSGGIGQRGAASPSALRPSITSHLVSTVYHANQARARFTHAARGARSPFVAAFLPDELVELDPEIADARLHLLSTVAYARLGFREEVSAVLSESPDLVDLETCFPTLDRFLIPVELRPWVCEMISHHLRDVDEVAAYRFGVLAVEGEERFGYALTAEAIADIDQWILYGARLRFVCPESQTPYLPGERRSPISGIPHMDYIAVERPPDGR